MEVHRLVAFARENGVGGAFDRRQFPLVQGPRQHASGELPGLYHDAANRIRIERRGHTIHDHRADGHQPIAARAVRFEIHSADETGPLVGCGGRLCDPALSARLAGATLQTCRAQRGEKRRQLSCPRISLHAPVRREEALISTITCPVMCKFLTFRHISV